MSMKPNVHFFFLLLLLALCSNVQGHFTSYRKSSTELISDGINKPNYETSSYLLSLKPLTSAELTCEETYGFMPCTTTVLGNLFLMLVYGYLMYSAAKWLSSGSEILLEILGPGFVGGLFLPVLTSLPDAMLILVSGLSGSTETVQSQVSVGIGLLAGSTVLVLSLIWGSCVVVGKCDIEESTAKDDKDTKGFYFTGSGVSTNIWTSYSARIMAVSVIPFLIVQLPQLLNSTSARRIAVLVALIVSVTLFVSCCVYQVSQPWVQKRHIAYAKHKHVISGILQHLKMRALGWLLDDDGEPNKEVIDKLFHTIDQDHDGYLSATELRALIIGVRFDQIELNKDDAVEKLMQEFDTSPNSRVDIHEFFNGVSKWVNVAKRVANSSSPSDRKFLTDLHSRTKQEHDLLAAGDQSEEAIEGRKNLKVAFVKAIGMLLVGTLIAAVVAEPLVDVVDNFSEATSIPNFFVSFIVLPLFTASEGVSAITFASRKKIRTASLTFSQLYGSVTMKNVLCLSVFLALVYFRELTWDFSAEVLVILIVCTVMGVFASLRTTFPLDIINCFHTLSFLCGTDLCSGFCFWLVIDFKCTSPGC